MKTPISYYGGKQTLLKYILPLIPPHRLYTEAFCGGCAVETYDTEDAFHFVDPPYINSNCGHYTGSFLESDFINLLDLLSKIKGKFMLTMFPHPLIVKSVEKYGWTINKLERNITASLKSMRKQEEWIIVNYK